MLISGSNSTVQNPFLTRTSVRSNSWTNTKVSTDGQYSRISAAKARIASGEPSRRGRRRKIRHVIGEVVEQTVGRCGMSIERLADLYTMSEICREASVRQEPVSEPVVRRSGGKEGQTGTR